MNDAWGLTEAEIAEMKRKARWLDQKFQPDQRDREARQESEDRADFERDNTPDSEPK